MNSISGKTNKYNVHIAGISYQLITNESQEYVREISGIADNAISKILSLNSSLSVSQATILATINFIDAFKKSENRLEESERKISELSENAIKNKADYDVLRESHFELKKEVLRLNELNKQLELEIASLRQQELTEPIEHSALVKDFLENISDPFAPQTEADDEIKDENAMFQPLKQQSLDDI